MYRSGQWFWLYTGIFFDKQIFNKYCAPGHPDPHEFNPKGDEIVYLPPNATSLIQSLDLGIKRKFKALSGTDCQHYGTELQYRELVCVCESINCLYFVVDFWGGDIKVLHEF